MVNTEEYWLNELALLGIDKHVVRKRVGDLLTRHKKDSTSLLSDLEKLRTESKREFEVLMYFVENESNRTSKHLQFGKIVTWTTFGLMLLSSRFIQIKWLRVSVVILMLFTLFVVRIFLFTKRRKFKRFSLLSAWIKDNELY